MNCSKCNKPNRPSAKYCKWCGTALNTSAGTNMPSGNTPSTIEALIGKDNVVSILKDVLLSASNVAAQGKLRGINMRRDMCFAITGVPGVGKNTVAEALTSALASAGIVSKPIPKVVKAADYEDFVKKLDENIKPIKGNVLIIDDAHKHSPNKRAEELCALDKILDKSRDWGPDPDKPILILIGDNDLQTFLELNPSARAQVKTIVNVPAPDINDLTEICCRRLAMTWRCYPKNDAVKAKIGRVIAYAKREKPDTFTYGHFASDLADKINDKYCNKGVGDCLITEDLIDGKEYIPKSLDDVMREFDKFVGIEEIKETIMQIAKTVEKARENGGEAAANGSVKSHFIFKGNPGTGKTTMARLFTEALSALGALPSGHLVEKDSGKLISKFVGDTPKQVRAAVNEAIGGVLFIDEAYQLCSGDNDEYGKQAVATLLKDCEDLRGKFVCIMAGYPIEMDRLMQTNPGFDRRFDKTVNFRDYTGPELAQIFRNMAAADEDKITFAPDLETKLQAYFDKIYATRSSKFGNAGTVRNILATAKSRMTARIAKLEEEGRLTPEQEHVMTLNDLEGDEGKATVEDVLSSLDDLVGMSEVKGQIEKIARTVKLNNMRAAAGRGKIKVKGIHLAITGNPGTGKTTVAKRLGKIFKAIGALPTDRVVVKKREDILDSMANSAGPNMRKAVEDAMGGILFIDEAYNLMPVDQPGTKDADGAAAVEALMTCMSEREGQFVTVIAGYPIQIDEFIRNANPGLQRRFTHRIHIPDYNVDELVKIYENQVKDGGFVLTDGAREMLNRKVEEMVTAKDEKFGNAGDIVKLFDQTLERQSMRLDFNIDPESEALFTIEAEDIPYDAPKRLDMDEIMAKLDHLEGLAEVKKTVRDLIDTITAQQERDKESGAKSDVPLSHYLFLGNPGTGKTTVARIMGDIFYSLGLLPSNKVISLSAKDLVAPHVGQTSPKANAAMMRGMGGVVFIDEAYSITQSPGGFGKEAVAEILQVMENKKGKFICIAAGYHKEMQEFLESNSGLASRFTATVNFSDYSAEELCHIAQSFFKSKKLVLTEDAQAVMLEYFNEAVRNKTDKFANAREARNFVDKVILNQGARLRQELSLPNFDRKRLFGIEASDMIIDD